MKQRIYFNEVVTRDGFQMEPEFVPTDTKIELINKLSQCGYAKVEVTSFTSAKAIPMLRDAEEVMGRITRVPGVEYTVLVPNLRGAEGALKSGVHKLTIPCSASEAHSLANVRKSRKDMVEEVRAIVRLRGTAQAFGLDWPAAMPLKDFEERLDPADPREAAFLMAARRGAGLLARAGFWPRRRG